MTTPLSPTAGVASVYPPNPIIPNRGRVSKGDLSLIASSTPFPGNINWAFRYQSAGFKSLLVKSPHLPLPSSPKLTYRLAHFLEIKQLKELALDAIRRQFTPTNVADTIFAEGSGSYSDILSAALDFASTKKDELKVSAGWKRKLDEMEDSEWGTRVLKQVVRRMV